METIRELQAYGYAFGSVFFALILYWYMYSIYTSKKKGGTDYEKYANLALDDSIDDTPIENYEPSKEEKQTRSDK